nr:hypothetical protein DM860_012590 [Ipomoea batatas]
MNNDTGIDPFKLFPDKSRSLRLDNLPILGDKVRLGKEVKLRWRRVPQKSASGRLISETADPSILQTMSLQLQRFLRLDSDHELSGKEDPLHIDSPLFHFRRASASFLADDVVVSNTKKQGNTRKMSAATYFQPKVSILEDFFGG